MNGDSECPQRYKDSTIAAFIKGALTHCSSWTQVHTEVERATQVLTNNGFPNKDIERVTRKIIDKWYNPQDINTTAPEEIKIFYKALFSNIYQEDERVMQQIVQKTLNQLTQR